MKKKRKIKESNIYEAVKVKDGILIRKLNKKRREDATKK